jgi:hypothetical protein
MSVVPIRPNLNIAVSSDALRFCEDAVADFVDATASDPRGAMLVLFDDRGHPHVSLTNVSANDMCFIGCWLQKHGLEVAEMPE